MTGRGTALVVVVDEAGPVVGDFRRRFDPGTARHIPPHVALLSPFVDASAAGEGLFASLEGVYAAAAPFDFELARIERFQAHVWLAPEPRDRFVELIGLTAARFPEWPPYGGVFTEPVPHLTIGAGDDVDTLVAIAERELGPALPVGSSARAVSLLEEQPDGAWAERASFRLGGR